MNSRRAEKTTAAERTENMIEKIKYWLFQKGNNNAFGDREQQAA